MKRDDVIVLGIMVAVLLGFGWVINRYGFDTYVYRTPSGRVVRSERAFRVWDRPSYPPPEQIDSLFAHRP